MIAVLAAMVTIHSTVEVFKETSIIYQKQGAILMHHRSKRTRGMAHGPRPPFLQAFKA